MANIVFLSQHGTSFLLPAFALGRKLQRRGHTVTFCAQVDCEDLVRKQGFAFLGIWKDIFPKGWLAKKDEIESKPDMTAELPYPKEYLVELFADMKRATLSMGEGELQRVLGTVRPDCFITDTDVPEFGLAAHGFKVPVFSFSAVMASPRDEISPPLCTPFEPDDSPEFLEKNRAVWNEIIEGMKKEYEEWGDKPAILRKLASQFGYDPARIDTDVEMSPRLLDHPELMFFPKAFDLPRRKPIENGYHVEPMVDLDRMEPAFDESWLRPDKKLIYCAVGTWDVITNREGIKGFFQSVIDATKARPQFQAVLAIGKYLQPSDFNLGPSVLAVPELPQIRLLQRAALSIHHAGRATVMETIYFGVPMLAAWSGRDNPGYAVRVAHHGLGISRQMEEVSPEDMGNILDALEAPRYRDNLKKMSAHFKQLEKDSPAVALIEMALAGKPLPPPS